MDASLRLNCDELRLPSKRPDPKPFRSRTTRDTGTPTLRLLATIDRGGDTCNRSAVNLHHARNVRYVCKVSARAAKR